VRRQKKKILVVAELLRLKNTCSPSASANKQCAKKKVKKKIPVVAELLLLEEAQRLCYSSAPLKALPAVEECREVAQRLVQQHVDVRRPGSTRKNKEIKKN
jgi:hypothetical protein